MGLGCGLGNRETRSIMSEIRVFQLRVSCLILAASSAPHSKMRVRVSVSACVHTGVYLCLMDFLSYSLLPLCGWVDICGAQTLKDTIFAVDYSQNFFFGEPKSRKFLR